MSYKICVYRLWVLVLVFIVTGCSPVTKDKYILPKGYKGFFGVIYQSDSRLGQSIVDGERLFIIEANGVCESGFGFAKGPIKQVFYFEDGKKISDIGFITLGRLDIPVNQNKLKTIYNDLNKICAILIYSANTNGGDSSYAIYCIQSGYNLIHFLKKNEDIYNHLIMNYDFDWQENKESMAKNIARLNKELAGNKPPFN